MTCEEMFEQHENEHLKFDRVDDKKSTRPGIHAFLLLDQLNPGTRDLIAYAEHDQYWIDFPVGMLSEENVIELLRCGICYDDNCESLYSFT